MRFFVLLIAAVLVATAAIVVINRTTREVPGPPAEGEAVSQTIVDDEGRTQTWQVTKREVPADKRAERVLPLAAEPVEANEELNQAALLLNDRAMRAWETGDIRGALELFRAAVADQPGVAKPYTNYGRLLTQMVALQEALPLLERAAELAPDDPQVWLDLQTLYERAILLERAFYARKKAEELVPGWRIVRDERGFWVLEGT